MPLEKDFSHLTRTYCKKCKTLIREGHMLCDDCMREFGKRNNLKQNVPQNPRTNKERGCE